MVKNWWLNGIWTGPHGIPICFCFKCIRPAQVFWHSCHSFLLRKYIKDEEQSAKRKISGMYETVNGKRITQHIADLCKNNNKMFIVVMCSWEKATVEYFPVLHLDFVAFFLPVTIFTITTLGCFLSSLGRKQNKNLGRMDAQIHTGSCFVFSRKHFCVPNGILRFFFDFQLQSSGGKEWWFLSFSLFFFSSSENKN